jgi:hypothetical protein
MRTINCIEGKIYVQSRGPIFVEWTISVYDKQNIFTGRIHQLLRSFGNIILICSINGLS